MSKRAVIYTRESTEKQFEKGHGWEKDLRDCREYASRNDLEIVEELIDTFTGSSELENRPEGRKVVSLMESGAVDAVIIPRQDRFSREVLPIDFLNLVQRAQGAGIELHFADRGRVPTDNPWALIANIAEQMKAGEDKKQIVINLREGKNDKARSGQVVMTGHPPFGYRREGKGEDARMTIYEPEAIIVQKIFQWYVYGDEESGPLSLREICARLDDEKIPTPQYRKPAAEDWFPSTVHGILINPIYTGVCHYGKSRFIKQGPETRRVKQNKESWIPIPVPELAIIDQAVFDAVQVRTRQNQEQAKRNRKREYLLSGHFRCGVCGAVMCGSFYNAHHGGATYYRCSSHWKKSKQTQCEIANQSISSKADSAVWGWLVSLFNDDEALLDALRKMEDRSESELEPKRQRLAMVEEFIEKTERKIARLVNALGEEEDTYTAATYKEEIRKAGKQKEAFADERERLRADLAQGEIARDLQAQILQQAHQIREDLLDANYEEQRELLNVLNVKVIFHSDEAGRWLEASCRIRPEGDVIELYPSSTRWRRSI